MTSFYINENHCVREAESGCLKKRETLTWSICDKQRKLRALSSLRHRQRTLLVNRSYNYFKYENI